MQLVIVESPTKIKSISSYLGKGYEVMATMGHIRDLPKSKMGVEILEKKTKTAVSRYSFEPEYMVVKGKGKQVASLRKAAKGAERVILATDLDREGEAIAYHVAEILKIKNPKRVVFGSITKEAILEAFKKPRGLDMDLVNAQQARRVLDRVVGYELSPVLWRKIRRGLSAGRVQSVAVRLVVEREAEIEAFKPEEYWVIVGEYKGNFEKSLVVSLAKKNGKKYIVKDEAEAKKIKTYLGKNKAVVKSVVSKERRLFPKPPFKTSTLQQVAASRLGWSAKNTMRVAQGLYEKGMITYHRTDSLSLSSKAIDDIRRKIKVEYGEKYLPSKPVFYKTRGKVVAQEAHEAIRPTKVSALPKGSTQEDKLYRLIWEKAIASQMEPAVVDQTKIVVESGELELEVNGQVVKFDGFRKAWGGELSESVLPAVSEGEDLRLKSVDLEQKFTQGPARFNDASLIKEMEKRGIGRPSTYAPTISTILGRGYVERRDKRFFATKIGVVVTEFLMNHFGEELDYEFTAKMERDLDKIAEGKKGWEGVLSKFYARFHPSVEKAIEKADRVKIPTEKTGKKCPDCKEGEIVIREGRFGRFLSCDRFPECKYTAPLIENLSGAECEDCGGKVVVRRTRTGRTFYGCENYPKCKWASWKKPKVEE